LDTAIKPKTYKGPQIEIILRNLNSPNDEALSQIIGYFFEGNSTSKVGVLNEPALGPLNDEWNKSLISSSKKIDFVNLNLFVDEVMSVKDNDEIDALKVSGKFACSLMSKLIKNFESIIDDEKTVSHKTISNQIKALIEDNLNFKKQFKEKNKLNNVDVDQLEIIFPPIIQSGGNYDMKYSCSIDDNNLSSDVIICKIGVRYKDYNTLVTRSYMIDSDKV